MTHLIRYALGAALLATVASCDSAPGALDPPAPGPATLNVHNSGSRTITGVDVVKCSGNPNGDVRYVPVSIAPGQNWSRQYALGCHVIDIIFATGGEWTTSVNLSATTPTQINPF